MPTFFTIVTVAILFFVAVNNRSNYVAENRRKTPLVKYEGSHECGDGKKYHIIRLPDGIHKRYLETLGPWAYYAIPDDGTPFDLFQPSKYWEFDDCCKCMYNGEIFERDVFQGKGFNITIITSEYGNPNNVSVKDPNRAAPIFYNVARDGTIQVVIW